MLINEYINQLYDTNYSSELNELAVKCSMALALAADNGCLIGQCRPDLWNFIYKMNETKNYEMLNYAYSEDESDSFYLERYLLTSYRFAETLAKYKSQDENLYVIACNPSEDMFYIGCSLNAYFSKFSKYFNENELLLSLINVVKNRDEIYEVHVLNLVKEYFDLSNNGIHELYIPVNKFLKKFFVAQTPVYPFHHMWNGYTPWRLFDERVIKELSELKLLPMKYKDSFISENEEKHTLKIRIEKGNIVDFDTDAIVNAANEQLAAGGGVCGAIFKAAGYSKLSKACNQIGYCKTGQAVITDGFDLKAHYIIHTVGPIYRDDSSTKYLKNAYKNTLDLADKYCCKSISIPSISTGIYGYPKDKAVKIAIDEILNFHAAILDEIVLVCFDDESFEMYKKELFRQEKLNKIKGCLLGGAMGDALGYPVEFMSYNQIVNNFGKDGIIEYELENSKALISDDTQMTLFTAVGLLWWETRWKTKGVSPSPSECAYWAYLDWLETQSIKVPKHHDVSWIKCKKQLHSRRAPGNTCLSALMSGKMGTIEKRINNSKGCGGVMRVAPYGLIGTDPSASSLEAANNAAITHGHDLGIIPAAYLAYLISSILNKNYVGFSLSKFEINNNILYDVLLNIHMRCFADLYNKSKDGLFDKERVNSFYKLLQKAFELSKEKNNPIDDINKLGQGWVAEEALAIAIYSVLKGKSFEDTLIIAVNHDGDSDSTGAIAGNIAGAWYGYNRIPLKFKENLELKNTMKEIAEDLCDGCPMDSYGGKHDLNWIKKYMPYY